MKRKEIELGMSAVLPLRVSCLTNDWMKSFADRTVGKKYITTSDNYYHTFSPGSPGIPGAPEVP